MSTVKDTIGKIEILYNAFKENPTRLTYSTSKLQKQFNATQEEVLEAKLLYRINPLDFTAARAMAIIKNDNEDSFWNTNYTPNTPYVSDCVSEYLEKFAKELKEYKPNLDSFVTGKGEDEVFCKNIKWMNINGNETRPIIQRENSESLSEILTDVNKEDEWEVKQKWVKGKEGSQLLVKKEPETDYKKEFHEFVNSYQPQTYPEYKIPQGKKLAVVCAFDLHIGKVAFHKYTGNIDGLHQQREYQEEFHKLIDFVKTQNVEHIYLPIGNDLFNVDDTRLTTTKGTLQDNTKDLHGMFKLGLDLMTTTIDALVQICPVTVILVPGNHATNSETYLALSLESVYRENPSVFVDHRPIPRKYYGWYNNLIGFAHGELPLKKYAELLPYEAKEYFSSCEHIEMLVGDKHIEETFKNHVVDGNGLTIRRLAALTKTDNWHYLNGYTLSKRRSYVLIYDKWNGLEIQYTNNSNDSNNHSN